MEGDRTESGQSLANLRFLLITQDNGDNYQIGRHLASWGAHLTLCKSAARAFACLIDGIDSGNPVTAVIIDHLHPEIDPLQFAAMVKCEPELEKLNLVHIGPQGNRTLGNTLRKAGYTLQLTTPIDKSLLFNLLLNKRPDFSDHDRVTPLIKHYGARNQQSLDVLLADGDAKAAESARLHLTNSGHRVFSVAGGEAAMEALDSHHFDLAMIDMNLPGIDGLEVLKLYHFARLDQPWIPTVVMADSIDTRTLRKCDSANANLCISKPLSSQKLLNAIDQVIKEMGSYDAASDPFPNANGHDTLIDAVQLNNLKALATRRDFLENLISQFETESRQLLEAMEHAARENQPAQLLSLSHKMKDTAGNMGAIHLYRLVCRITHLGDTPSSSQLSYLLTDVKTSLLKTVDALHNHLISINSSHSK